MTNASSGILTPKQREFLREGSLENQKNPAKSMMRNRIAEQIQMSYTEDVPLIASALVTDTGYNSLTTDRIVPRENKDKFVEGLKLQIALVRELAKGAGADPDQIVQDGLNRELMTIRDQIRLKAFRNPGELTLSEARQIEEDLPDEFVDQIDQAMKKLNEGQESTISESKRKRSSNNENKAERIAEELDVESSVDGEQ